MSTIYAPLGSSELDQLSLCYSLWLSGGQSLVIQPATPLQGTEAWPAENSLLLLQLRTPPRPIQRAAQAAIDNYWWAMLCWRVLGGCPSELHCFLSLLAFLQFNNSGVIGNLSYLILNSAQIIQEILHPFEMSASLNNSTVSHYRSACSRVTQNRVHSVNQSPKENNKDGDRLTFKDIQNITKSMLRDKKAHEHNLGVLHSVKGKMYCLKLGEVAQFKQFSHYFYTSQYRRKISQAESNMKATDSKTGIKRTAKKMTTQPAEEDMWGCWGAQDSKDVQRLHLEENREMQMLGIDGKLKQKINKLMLPMLGNEERARQSRSSWRRCSINKML